MEDFYYMEHIYDQQGHVHKCVACDIYQDSEQHEETVLAATFHQETITAIGIHSLLTLHSYHNWTKLHDNTAWN